MGNSLTNATKKSKSSTSFHSLPAKCPNENDDIKPSNPESRKTSVISRVNVQNLSFGLQTTKQRSAKIPQKS